MPKIILVTGFEPFDGERVNPSWEIAARLDGWTVGDHLVVARRLPCVFAPILEALDRELTALSPDIVVAIGQAGGRVDLSLERVAINVDDARIADNTGARPIDEPVVAGGPAAYFTTLPVKATRQRLHEAGLPASVSNTAGTFVCNHAFYALRHLVATTHGGVRAAGFVHIPYLPQQALRHPGAASMGLETLEAAFRIVLDTAVAVRVDEPIAAGATH